MKSDATERQDGKAEAQFHPVLVRSEQQPRVIWAGKDAMFLLSQFARWGSDYFFVRAHPLTLTRDVKTPDGPYTQCLWILDWTEVFALGQEGMLQLPPGTFHVGQ